MILARSTDQQSIVKSKHQYETANHSKIIFNEILTSSGFSEITTEIEINMPSFPAEEYHQQYLAKNPNGYCGIKGTGCTL